MCNAESPPRWADGQLSLCGHSPPFPGPALRAWAVTLPCEGDGPSGLPSPVRQPFLRRSSSLQGAAHPPFPFLRAGPRLTTATFSCSTASGWSLGAACCPQALLTSADASPRAGHVRVLRSPAVPVPRHGGCSPRPALPAGGGLRFLTPPPLELCRGAPARPARPPLGMLPSPAVGLPPVVPILVVLQLCGYPESPREAERSSGCAQLPKAAWHPLCPHF